MNRTFSLSLLMPTTKQVLEQLTTQYPSLTRQLKRAAKYILDHPEEVVIQSMRQLSVSAGVAPTTMVRLSKQVSFNSYSEFRRVFEQGLKTRSQDFSGRTQWLQALSGSSHGQKVLAQYSDAVLHNFNTMIGSNSLEHLMQAVELMQKADTVYVTSLGAMYHLAGYFQSVGEMIMPKMRLVDPMGAVGINDLSRMSEKDVLMVLYAEPYSKGSVASARFAADRGTRLIIITDSRAAPVASEADVLFLIPVTSPLFYPSQIAVMALLEALLVLMAAEGGESVVENMRDIESFRQNPLIYWREK